MMIKKLAVAFHHWRLETASPKAQMKSLTEAKESLIDENIEQAIKNETISEDDALELKRESLLSYVKELEGESTLKSSSSGRQKPLPAYLKPTVASSRSAYPFLNDVRDVWLRGFGDRIHSPSTGEED